jgi:lysophospholipase L1-like esterase
MPIRTGEAQKRLKAFLDRHTPHQRLAWVSGSAAALVTFAGLGFGLPAPTAAAAFSSSATPSALQILSPNHSRSLLEPLPPLSASASGSPGSSSSGLGPSAPGSQPIGPFGAPVTQAKHRPTPAPGAILGVGDSVMLGCAPNLTQLLGHGLRVDAIVGRQAEATIARLAQYRAAGQLPDTVIVQIGDNGAVWYADMQHLRKVLKGVQHVVLVNVRIARSWQNEVNVELKSYARTWPQAVIANWYSHSTQTMLTDGVHPSIAARAVYARVVSDAVELSEAKVAPSAGGKSGGGQSGGGKTSSRAGA